MRLTDPSVNWRIDQELINGVITAAVWAEGQHPGAWQKMIRALDSGASKTKEGTVNAFLFHAMVDRLLEEFHKLEDGEDEVSRPPQGKGPF